MMKRHAKKFWFTPTPVLPSFRFFEKGVSLLWTFSQNLRLVMRSVGALKQWQNRCRGFTLIELIVVIGVFSVITGVVLARYRSYGTSVEFTNAVENIVLALREAQVYGAGSKTAGTSCGTPASEFNCAYGVRFADGGTSYIIFIDEDDEKDYDNGEELPNGVVNLPAGITLSLSPSTVDIVFKRPFPDATINGSAANTSASVMVIDGTKSQTIMITSTGLISIQ